MKTALVITDGLRQVVLTPEDDEEKAICKLIVSQQWEFTVKGGEFFICAGGYARFGLGDASCQSAILVLRPPTAQGRRRVE